MADNTTPTPFSLSWFASKDDLIAAQAARITELEAELEAVGAGGVQALRSPIKTAEGAATQIEPTHSKHPFFSYDPDVGFETHKTEQEAQQAAKESIAQYRDIADETWPAEATEVYYGLILGESCEIDSGVVNDEGNRCVEFELRPVQAAPQPQVEPAINFATLYEFAAKNAIDYNELCATARAAIVAAPHKVESFVANADVMNALQEARSVILSINRGLAHQIDVDGDVCYWQRDEWVNWAINDVLPQLEAALATTQPAAAVYLPLLIRDIARDMHITTTDACIALKPLGNFSVNSAVTAEMASKLREHFHEPAAPKSANAGEYPALPKRHCYADDGEECVTFDQMFAFADATHAMRSDLHEVAIEELAQMGYTFKGGMLVPPDHVGELMAVVQSAPCGCQDGTCETKSDRACRMTSEIRAMQAGESKSITDEQILEVGKALRGVPWRVGGRTAEVLEFSRRVLALRGNAAPQGEQEPWGYAVEGRIFVGAALPEHVQKMAAEHDFRVLKLYTSHVAPTAQEPAGARYRRIGRHVAEIAKRLGRPDDSAEGELEYIQRLSYSQGLEDASPVATHGEQDALDVEVSAYTVRSTKVERVAQMDGTYKWAVRRNALALNKQGEWEYEPLPSRRDYAFLERCRFHTAKAAIDAALSATTPKKD